MRTSNSITAFHGGACTMHGHFVCKDRGVSVYGNVCVHKFRSSNFSCAFVATTSNQYRHEPPPAVACAITYRVQANFFARNYNNFMQIYTAVCSGKLQVQNYNLRACRRVRAVNTRYLCVRISVATTKFNLRQETETLTPTCH